VAHNPSKENIQLLKRSLAKKQAALQAETLAGKAVEKAKLALRAAMQKALSTTVSNGLRTTLNDQLQKQTKATVMEAKNGYAAAMAASKKAQTLAKAQPTQANINAAKADIEKVKVMKTKLTSATALASKMLTEHAVPNKKSVKEVKAAIQAAEKKKESLKKLAMAQPTDANLSSFKQQVQKVHSLQTQLLVAKAQNSKLRSAGPAKSAQKSPLAKKNVPANAKALVKGGKDLVANLVSYYCDSAQDKKLCSFYTQFQKTSLSNVSKTAQKKLFQLVGNSKKSLNRVRAQLAAARAAAASKPSTQKITQVKNLRKEYKVAELQHKGGNEIVRRLMKHQHQSMQKLKSNTNVTQTKTMHDIGKLITFYCAHNKYASLCSFYKKLKAQHQSEGHIRS